MFSKLLFLLAAISPHISSTPVTTKTDGDPSRPIVLVVSFDGFRHSYISPSRTPILTNLSLSGSTVPYLQPSFPTKTFPNHHSIATGLYPESHGVIDNVFFDPLYNKTLDGKKDDLGFWNYDENVLPLYVRNELQGGVSGCMMWPGSYQGYGKDSKLLPTYRYPKYDAGLSWESRVNTVIRWMTDKLRPANLVFLYYHQPDSAGHRYGPNGEETLHQVEETDKRVGYLIDKLQEVGIYEKVNLVLLSDHGMAEVTSERIVDLSEFVDREKLVQAVNGWTPVIQVVPKVDKYEDLYRTLEKGSKGRNFTVFKKEELCEEPYFYCKSRRIMDFVTLADPGWAFRDFKEKGSVEETSHRKVFGSHGYVNTAESMRAFLIARGPAFQQSYVTDKPVKNVDVVPLVSKILGLVNVPSNGTLNEVGGIIKG